MMTDSVRAATILAGDREVYRQKFLNRAGDNSVSRTAPQRLSARHPCVELSLNFGDGLAGQAAAVLG
jgi:hypothetical protein